MRKKIKVVLTIVLIIIVFLLIKAYVQATNIAKNLAKATFDANISVAVYSALTSELEMQGGFEGLQKVVYNASGDVSFISTDTLKANQIAHSLANKAYSNFQKIADKGVDIPLGAFTGVPLISGFGAKVNVKIINMVSVKCEFVSSFTTAGINQTKQTLYVNVVPDYAVITPVSNYRYSDKISILVYENIIVGKVPNVFLDRVTIGESGKLQYN